MRGICRGGIYASRGVCGCGKVRGRDESLPYRTAVNGCLVGVDACIDPRADASIRPYRDPLFYCLVGAGHARPAAFP